MSNFKDFDLDLKKVSSESEDEKRGRTIVTTVSLIGTCASMSNPTLTLKV